MLKDRRRSPTSGAVLFVICSILGILAFFVQIRVNGNARIPVDHIIAWVKALLGSRYGAVVVLLILCSVAMRIFKKERLSGMGLVYLVQSAAALVFVCLGMAGLLPEGLRTIMDTALSATGNILCAILVTSFFVPLLVEYGLVDFVGVLVRPFMRRVFLTPGSSAVIGVSAFLGNYSMGHILSRKMYDEGQFTQKEGVIVALGFSTCSIGLMINLANYIDIMPHWNLYVLSILAVTFLTTIIVSRIPPISRKSDAYAPGVRAREETYAGGRLLAAAWAQGIEKAASAPSFARALADIMKRVTPVICEITGTSMFVVAAALILLEYTELFSWIGMLFLPVLLLCGVSLPEARLLATPIGASLFEPVLSGVICDGVMLSAAAQWIITVVPYSSIIFFAGFLPSLWKSRIQCTIGEALLVWVERMALGIVFSAAIARMLAMLGII